MSKQNSQPIHSFVYHLEPAKKKKTELIELIRPMGFIILVIVIVAFSRSLYFFSVKKNSIKKTQIEKNFQEGKKLLSEGQFELAEKFLEKAVKTESKNTKNTNYFQNLAVAKYNLKDYQGAIKNYEKIIKINSEDAFSYNGLGNIYRDLGRKEIAKENYKKAIEVDPRFTVAYSNLALLLDEENKKEEAIKILEEGIKANPESEGLKGVLKILGK